MEGGRYLNERNKAAIITTTIAIVRNKEKKKKGDRKCRRLPPREQDQELRVVIGPMILLSTSMNWGNGKLLHT
jgi:hypothetical protein